MWPQMLMKQYDDFVQDIYKVSDKITLIISLPIDSARRLDPQI